MEEAWASGVPVCGQWDAIFQHSIPCSGFPIDETIQGLNYQPYCSTNGEVVAVDASYTLNPENLCQSDVTTLGFHDDELFSTQASATCDPLLQHHSAQPTSNECAEVSMFEANLGLNSELTEEIEGLFQGDQQYSLGGLASDSEFTGYFHLDQPDEGTLNMLGAAPATEIPPSVETATALLSSPNQIQESASAKTAVPKPRRCATCSLQFETRLQLREHCSSVNHHEFACPILGCKHECDRQFDLSKHIRDTHPESRVCNQCQKAFTFLHDLADHASNTSHASYVCLEEDCGKTYSRFDVFQRHQDTHRDNAQRFPCQHCKNYRGAKGFKRKDHLTQHLRNYHHIGVDEPRRNNRVLSCPHGDCPEWRPAGTQDDQHAFQKSSDYITHMRKVHKESEFPCTEPGCDRTGPKGYFRLRDLKKHKLKEHGVSME